MKKIALPFLFFCSIINLNAQQFDRIDVPFEKFGEAYKYALAGGLNSPQFSSVDLNNDAIMDMYIFDRTGNVSLTFINNGTANEPDYIYAPEHQQYFPELQEWVILRDYNGDGIMDVFAQSDVPMDPNFPGVDFVDAVLVYTGSYVNDHLVFDRFHFANDDIPFDIISVDEGGENIPLYVSQIDYPAIDDIDGDGDMDILSFAPGGGHVNYFENKSVEWGYGLDSLIFVLEDDCWGRFYESGINEVIDLSPEVDSCAFGFAGNSAEDRHAGSTLLTIDIDNDNDKELILGDLSLDNLNMLYNGGDNDFAFMEDQDTLSPKNTVVVDIKVFPASFLMDVDNDGKKDLLVSPNQANTGEDYEAVWFYKNTNSNEFPVFNYIKKDFLIEDMIDLGTGAHPTFLDYNVDGLLDLVVGNNAFYYSDDVSYKLPRIYLFENVGTSTSPVFNLVDDDYLEFSQYDNIGHYYGPSPTFGDLDNDGDLDVLIGLEDGKFVYGENTAGAGNPVEFGNLQFEYMGIDPGKNSTPQIVDLDRDGLPDLIVGNRVGTVTYFHNEGTPNDPVFVQTNNALGLIDTRYGNFIGQSAPVILDFDGDYQIFTGSLSGYLMHYSNIDGNINGTFTLESDYYGEFREGFNSHPAMADIDNDGVLEIIVGNERGGLSLFRTDITTVSTQYIYKKPEVNIFPNPANQYFNIEIKNGNNLFVKVSLFNAIGQEVLKGSFTSSNYTINCQGLSNGIYFAKFEMGGEVVVKKVVIGK